MIKISDIVGALVRSVTIARIQADVASGQASVEYLKDPTLRAFPVPRTEIQKAELGMKLAISDAEQAKPDLVAVAKKSLLDRIPAYVDRILSLPYMQGKPTRLRDAFGANTPAAAAVIVATLRERIAHNPMEFTSKWSKRQKVAAGKLGDYSLKGVYVARDTVKMDIPIDDGFLTQALQVEARAFCEATPQALKTANDVAAISAFNLDLAVKKEDVQSLPEHLVSEIRLSLVVENYEWATATDAQGNVVNRLAPK
ncbi:MAG: hypothetical protein QM820_63120 [Minicystis sp.]